MLTCGGGHAVFQHMYQNALGLDAFKGCWLQHVRNCCDCKVQLHDIQWGFMHWSQPADINECELETYPCNVYANCTDTDGSFNCTCREGFEGDGFNCTGKFYFCTQGLCTCLMTNLTFVADIPECERGLDGCDPNATCTNTIGSYVCNCNTGFTGDGFTCPG